LQLHNAPDYRQDQLFHLHELDRINKHRFLLPAAGGHMGTGVGHHAFADTMHIEWMMLGGDPIVGPDGSAELGRYRGWHMIAGQRRMNVPLTIDKDAVFSIKPFRGVAVAPTLQGILQHIRDNLVAALRPFF